MDRPPKVHYLGGQIEVESCISLRHPRCWNPKSTLKTSREYGAGLGQLTKAYRADGTIRFDALSEIRRTHMKELHELTWSNILNRPDLQVRAILLKMKDNYLYYSKYTKDPYTFALVSYNGGVGGLDKDRRACTLSSSCDPSIWYGNVENYCMKSKTALYGNRSACDINRHYPYEISYVRSSKYKKYLLP